MDLAGASVALYGRFRGASRGEIAERVRAAGGLIARDLTRRSEYFVVGARSANLIASGHLSARLARAERRGVQVFGEDRFRGLLDGATAGAATLEAASAAPGLSAETLRVLHAFGLITFAAGKIGFGDAQTARAAARLLADGHNLTATIDAMRQAAGAPPGRRKLVSGPDGVALEWDEGLTDLKGQGLLPLDPIETVDELFESALLAEAEGEMASAERLYAICARADRRDAIALFNLANIQAGRGAFRDAITNYRLAAARDPEFVEAEYNLARVLEEQDNVDGAEAALERALRVDPKYGDALFNLAQIMFSKGSTAEAAALYWRYLATDPPEAWAKRARRALEVISAEEAER